MKKLLLLLLLSFPALSQEINTMILSRKNLDDAQYRFRYRAGLKRCTTCAEPIFGYDLTVDTLVAYTNTKIGSNYLPFSGGNVGTNTFSLTTNATGLGYVFANTKTTGGYGVSISSRTADHFALAITDATNSYYSMSVMPDGNINTKGSKMIFGDMADDGYFAQFAGTLRAYSTISLRATSTGEARYHMYNSGGQAEWKMGQKNLTSHNFTISKIVSGAESDYFSISNTNGNIGIGNLTPTAKLTVTESTAQAVAIGITNPTGGTLTQQFFNNGNYTSAGSKFLFGSQTDDATFAQFAGDVTTKGNARITQKMVVGGVNISALRQFYVVGDMESSTKMLAPITVTDALQNYSGTTISAPAIIANNAYVGTAPHGTNFAMFVNNNITDKLKNYALLSNNDGSTYISGVNVAIRAGNNANSITVFPTGNVGIGTEFDNGTKLYVNGFAKFLQNIEIGGNYVQSGADFRIMAPSRGSGGRAMVHDAGNILSINYAADFTGGVLVGPHHLFRGDGNVGIGTIAPAYRLHVVGTSLLDGNSAINGSLTIASDDSFFAMGNNANVGFTKKSGTFAKLTYNNQSPFIIAQSSGSNLAAANTFVDRFIVQLSGNVGINTTVDAGYKLDVAGTLRTAGKTTLINPAGNNIVYDVQNTTGGSNFQIRVNDLNSNIMMGVNAGQNTTGGYNTIVGTNSGINNTTGNNNTFFGLQSAFYNTTGANNTVIGVNTGHFNTTGSENVFVGNYSGNKNNAAFNTAIGYASGLENTTGAGNTFIGYNAGRFLSDGSTSNTITTNSVFLGFNSRAQANSQDNQIVIGYGSAGLGSNTTTIGNTATIKTKLYGQVEGAGFKLATLNTAPASSTDTGATGEIRVTAGFIYVCIATNTWVRSVLTTF